jgi:hypothetical protein
MSDEIEQLIRSHAGTVVVHLTEPVLEADQQMEWLATEISEWGADVRVVRVEYSLHREWARQYRVHGSPCTLVFREGELRLRVKGRSGRERLRRAFERAGLLRRP